MNILWDYKRITIYGLVQGIGFRPYVVRLAQKWGIHGEVCNLGGAVRIMASAPKRHSELVEESSYSRLDNFVNQLLNAPPPLSDILHVKIENLDSVSYQNGLQSIKLEGLPDRGEHHSSPQNIIRHKDEFVANFCIVESQEEGEGLVILPADLPVCDTCLSEMKDPQNRRYGHSLISCTHCGPRYSIIKKAPYDRCNTAMTPFDFCPECFMEYTTQESRRFHAQTVSCHHCGPQLVFKELIVTQDTFLTDQEEIAEKLWEPIDKSDWIEEGALLKTMQILKHGGIMAVKGIGGYHFLASPYRDSTVKNLRELKEREQKPFAICFPSMEAIKAYAEVSPQEEALFQSKARPIVLLEQKKSLQGIHFSPLVLQNSRYIGAFLPYTPILIQLCESVGPLIATSANLTDAPIINKEIDLAKFDKPLLSGVLTHEREIVISQDDSVAWVVCGKPQVIRRARGYTPLPVFVAPCENQHDISVLALGGELKSTFCLQKGPFAYMSQYLGDLGSTEAFRIYKENLVHMKSLMKVEPKVVACDLHPDYATTRLAQEMGLPIVRVQHHHAHIASVMAEKSLEGPVLGVSFDGTGYGSDGTLWGGEFLICEKDEFTRVAYLKPVPLLSGDESMKDCQKTATAYLHAFGLQDAMTDIRYPIIRGALEHGINTILSSSVGRLFDGVSSLLGLCQRNRYEGEGAILIENAAYRAINRYKKNNKKIQPNSESNVDSVFDVSDGFPNQEYPQLNFDIIEKDEALIMDPEQLIINLVHLLRKGPRSEKLTDELALGFHTALCLGIVEILTKLRRKTGIQEVVLSGGVFQNKILTESTVRALEYQGFKVNLPALIPVNDGGISLGQAYVAMKKFRKQG